MLKSELLTTLEAGANSNEEEEEVAKIVVVNAKVPVKEDSNVSTVSSPITTRSNATPENMTGLKAFLRPTSTPSRPKARAMSTQLMAKMKKMMMRMILEASRTTKLILTSMSI
jgi:hypothetical protein